MGALIGGHPRVTRFWLIAVALAVSPLTLRHGWQDESRPESSCYCNETRVRQPGCVGTAVTPASRSWARQISAWRSSVSAIWV